ncbi:hypothetical protein EJ02DRAFT_459765 [Clathrospora elynae]|uniref:RTA1-domain-containing protein n=1 Tax=Clathrospora elynae TaxID=706981 RepID=A0A6A5S9J4_9PLEO|nr:hypothetical protein EJ02DRAFT_459765 [Clathrospora elynae]
MATPTSTTFPSLTSTTSTSSPSCTTAIPGHNGYVPPTACNANWLYSPSFPAALAFAVLFGLLTLSHLFLAIVHRKRFCWVITMAAAWETTAFILRALGSHNQQNSIISLISTLLFLLAPLWINAFVYMTAGRIIWLLHPERKIWGLQAVKMGKWFVWLDILSFLVQATGGVMINPGSGGNTVNIGKDVYMTGVGVQQLFILLFLALVVRFHFDALKLERQGLLGGSNNHDNKAGGARWKWLTYTIYAGLLLITIRIIYRLAEFSGGIDANHNKLPFTEGYALGLDAVPMMLALLLLAIVHPGIVLKGPESKFPSKKERKAEKKAKKAEKKGRKNDRGLLESAGVMGKAGEWPRYKV